MLRTYQDVESPIMQPNRFVFLKDAFFAQPRAKTKENPPNMYSNRSRREMERDNEAKRA